jgi:hypothetical protein
MQEAVVTHLERLVQFYPNRKVAILPFASQVYPFLNGKLLDPIDFIADKIDTIDAGLKHALDLIKDNPTSDWPTVTQDFTKLRSHVNGLSTRGATAIGTALTVALALATEHKRLAGSASTEIYVCTDGASNTGIGSVDDAKAGGRKFYAQVGDVAVKLGAKVNVIGLEGEGVSLDVLAAASQASNGTVSIVDPSELRREIRTASQRRVIAKDVVIDIHAPPNWQFKADPRPAVRTNRNHLTYGAAQISDESEIGFAFAYSASTEDEQAFQAVIKYTSTATGDRNARILTLKAPVTHDPTQAENEADVATVGTTYLQLIGSQANTILERDPKLSATSKNAITALRDQIYATQRLLIRASKTAAQQEELANFTRESTTLDVELDRVMTTALLRSSRDHAISTFTKMGGLSRNAIFATNRRMAQIRRREMLK